MSTRLIAIVEVARTVGGVNSAKNDMRLKKTQDPSPGAELFRYGPRARRR